MRRHQIAGVVVAAALILSAAPAAAGTTVKVRGNDVTITVPVDCVGCNDWVAPTDGRDLAKHWERTAEKAWNDAFAKFSYCNKYKFTLDIKMKNRAADSGATFGRHRLVATTPDGRGFTGAGWGGAPESTPGGPPSQASTDGTRYYEFDAEGTMPADATPTVIAHEFGHVIGLGDDRDRAGDALPGRGRTLMVGGATGITPNANLKIDKQLVDRIGEQLANLGEIDCGIVWNGTLDGVGDNVGSCDRAVVFEGTFTLRERPTGGPTFAGQYTDTAADCGGAGTSTSTSWFIEGKRTERGFEFASTANFPFALKLRVSGDRATGHVSQFFGPVYRVTLDFEATCECDDAGRG